VRLADLTGEDLGRFAAAGHHAPVHVDTHADVEAHGQHFSKVTLIVSARFRPETTRRMTPGESLSRGMRAACTQTMTAGEQAMAERSLTSMTVSSRQRRAICLYERACPHRRADHSAHHHRRGSSIGGGIGRLGRTRRRIHQIIRYLIRGDCHFDQIVIVFI
jgi:hypothetical protein